VGEQGKAGLDVRAEAAGEVSSAFPEGQTVVGVVVEGASVVHFVVSVVEQAVVERAVVERAVVKRAVKEKAVVVERYFLGCGNESRASRAGSSEGVLEVADIEEVLVGSKVAVTGVA